MVVAVETDNNRHLHLNFSPFCFFSNKMISVQYSKNSINPYIYIFL